MKWVLVILLFSPDSMWQLRVDDIPTEKACRAAGQVFEIKTRPEGGQVKFHCEIDGTPT